MQEEEAGALQEDEAFVIKTIEKLEMGRTVQSERISNWKSTFFSGI